MLQAIEVARNVPGKVRPGGTLLLMGGTSGQHLGIGTGAAAAVTAAMPALTASLALELAPVRVNLIAPGFDDVDTGLSALLHAKPPIRHVVGPDNIAAGQQLFQ
ncbi:MAG TPA: hypothetical protein VGH27_15135 [Streptosporangiaceae bacterium]|jgi:NAD(P)-dependent dehydrogenase (short-subunit alcohol dehydrogenase family)